MQHNSRLSGPTEPIGSSGVIGFTSDTAFGAGRWQSAENAGQIEKVYLTNDFAGLSSSRSG
jgi:hypothetical protein